MGGYLGHMPHIAILSASVRTGRVSHRVARYFEKFIAKSGSSTTEIIDLNAYDFPIFHERLRHLVDPPANLLDLAQRITKADGVIIVTPEYNGGYPASLKNAIDVLYNEWYRKPVAISTVSDGSFGGTQVITSLQFSLWKIRAWTVPAMFKRLLRGNSSVPHPTRSRRAPRRTWRRARS